MKRYLAVTKALGDASRVRMLCALRGGELCVCQIIDLLGLAPSTVSKHLSVLNQADLIDSRKEGRWVYYRLTEGDGTGLTGRMTEETFRALGDDELIKHDEQRLQAIRTADLEELCRKTL